MCNRGQNRKCAKTERPIVFFFLSHSYFAVNDNRTTTSSLRFANVTLVEFLEYERYANKYTALINSHEICEEGASRCLAVELELHQRFTDPTIPLSTLSDVTHRESRPRAWPNRQRTDRATDVEQVLFTTFYVPAARLSFATVPANTNKSPLGLIIYVRVRVRLSASEMNGRI